MAGILDFLFGGAAPQAAPVPAQGPSAPVAQDGAQPQQGMLAGMTPEQLQAMIAQNQPGALTAAKAQATAPSNGASAQVPAPVSPVHSPLVNFFDRELGGPISAHDRQALAQRSAQYNWALGQAIQDPNLRSLYFTNPAAYAEVMKSRLSAHDTAAGATTTQLGANGDQAVNGSVVSKPGDVVGDTSGRAFQTNAPAPFAVPASESVYDPVSKTFKQAPAEPKVVTSGLDQNVNVVTPGAPGAPASAAAGAAPRGVSNNNPLNIKTLSGGQAYAGQTGADGPFAKFGTMQAGLQAADRLLQSKQALHGFNTLNQIIADPKFGWDPGNTQYAQDVAASVGIKPDAPLNLNDSTVRATVMHAMLPHEIGSAPAAKVSGGASVQPVQTAMQPQQVTPEEAQARGLAPGVWFKNPDGKYVQQSPAPKGDVDRVNNLVSAASTMDDLGALDQQFMQAANRTRPGLQYAGGKHNPVAMIAEHVNPDVKSMESISAQELFKMKPENAGARILQSELPFWERSALDPGSSLEANQGLAAQHAAQRSQIQAKAQFYQNWIYQHGNLNGADQAWAKARPQAAAPKPQPSAGGFRVIGQQ